MAGIPSPPQEQLERKFAYGSFLIEPGDTRNNEWRSHGAPPPLVPALWQRSAALAGAAKWAAYGRAGQRPGGTAMRNRYKCSGNGWRCRRDGDDVGEREPPIRRAITCSVIRCRLVAPGYVSAIGGLTVTIHSSHRIERRDGGGD